MSMNATSTDWTDQKREAIEDLAELRDTLETLAASDLPIAPNCQAALDRLDDYSNGGMN